jgi:hypothetical protein
VLVLISLFQQTMGNRGKEKLTDGMANDWNVLRALQLQRRLPVQIR